MKKLYGTVLLFTLCICVTGGILAWTALGNKNGAVSDETSDVQISSDEADAKEIFSDGDYKDVTSETPSASIILDGSSGTLSDTTRGSSGSNVTITSKGIYYITGQSDGVSILINETQKSGNIYLILDNVSMTNIDACIDIEAADKVILQCVGDNSLTSTNPENAAVFSRDDITINGGGALSVDSGKHGIVGKDEIKLTGATLFINSSSVGIKANDGVYVDGADINICSGYDGIQVDSDEGIGCFYITSGDILINAGYDGIDIGTSVADNYTGYIDLKGGSIEIISGGGYDCSKGETSQKGLVCDGNIYGEQTTLTVSSADDAIHCKGNMYISGGEINLSSSDDGIYTYDELAVSDGILNISKSYEGLEGGTVSISGGNITVFASDDGINTAGGSDGMSDETNTWNSDSLSGDLTVTGGNIYVNSNGDGFDSNRSIYITDGIIIIEGASNSVNGALDKGDSDDCVLSISGGTVLAVGAADMAKNFDSGSQCSALVSLSGSSGDTIAVDDGSGFTFAVSRNFSCVVYSSPYLEQGRSYTITAGENMSLIDFSAAQYYSNMSYAVAE